MRQFYRGIVDNQYDVFTERLAQMVFCLKNKVCFIQMAKLLKLVEPNFHNTIF